MMDRSDDGRRAYPEQRATGQPGFRRLRSKEKLGRKEGEQVGA